MCGKSANKAFEAARERLATAGTLLVTTHGIETMRGNGRADCADAAFCPASAKPIAAIKPAAARFTPAAFR